MPLQVFETGLVGALIATVESALFLDSVIGKVDQPIGAVALIEDTRGGPQVTDWVEVSRDSRRGSDQYEAPDVELTPLEQVRRDVLLYNPRSRGMFLPVLLDVHHHLFSLPAHLNATPPVRVLPRLHYPHQLLPLALALFFIPQHRTDVGLLGLKMESHRDNLERIKLVLFAESQHTAQKALFIGENSVVFDVVVGEGNWSSPVHFGPFHCTFEIFHPHLPLTKTAEPD